LPLNGWRTTNASIWWFDRAERSGRERSARHTGVAAST
jgi:hypothetical protein